MFSSFFQRVYTVLMLACLPFSALAETTNQITAFPKQMGMREPFSPVMERLFGFHDILMVIITVTTVFVLALMIYTCWRFSEKNNPVPSKTTHNVMIEVIWTIVPILILVAIAIPSLRHHYFLDATEMEDADMTIKIIGYQWYWNYEYPDHGGFAFDSYMIPDDEIDKSKNQIRLLSVDNPIYVPVGKKVLVQLTGGDVIHDWAMPSFGVKTDAVPGRVSQTWFTATEPGIYYGQCSELCGVKHGFMPIEVRAVPQAEFDAWVEKAKVEFAASSGLPTQFATNH